MAEKKEKVCILGFAPSWREAPFADQSYEIWCLNEMYKVAKQVPAFRADRWFEIHDRNSKSKATPEHTAFLKQCPVPLYMWGHYDDIPNSVRFPKDEIMRWLESKVFYGSGYFNNSISWMVALAMMEGFKHIAIYGVDMATGDEWGHQKPSCEYFIGLAEGMGIKVEIPDSSELLKCAQLYGFESNNKLRAWMKAQTQEMGKRVQGIGQQAVQLQQNLTQAQIAQAQCQGAQQAYKEILKRTQ